MKPLTTASLVFLAFCSAASAEVASPRTVSVVTSPRGGQLVVGGLIAGVDGLAMTQPRGTRLTVRCVLLGEAGWMTGRAELRFDGTAETTVCEMKRVSRCVPDLRNPFRACPAR